MGFREKTGKKVVLVGMYKTGQLERWPGLYNYPLNADDTVDVGAAKRVNEIWLFNGVTEEEGCLVSLLVEGEWRILDRGLARIALVGGE